MMIKTEYKKYMLIFATLIYAGGILWFSLQPDYGIIETPLWVPAFKNFLHIPAYAGLAVLLVLTYGAWKMDNGSRFLGFKGFGSPFSVLRSPFSIIFIIATSYGILNEFIQAGVPGRFYSVGDMARNAIGAGIGIWFMHVVITKTKVKV